MMIRTKIPLIPKELLEEYYIDQNLTINIISKKTNYSSYHIKNWLDYYKIPRRSNREELSLGVSYAKAPRNVLYTDKEWLYDQYITQHKYLQQISEEFNYPTGAISKYLEYFNIPKRNKSETRKGQKHSEETKKKMSDSHRGVPSAWINRTYSIETRRKISESKLGPKNPNWHKHPSEETKRKRQETLKRNKENGIFPKKHIFTPKEKEKMRIRNSHPGKSNSHYGKPCSRVIGQWYTKLDGNKLWMKSSYEIRVATVLDQLNIIWYYEYKRFEFSHQRFTYLPDFYLPKYNIWLEVKGFMRYSCREKIESFLTEYSNEILQIVYEKDIIEIESLIRENKFVNIYKFGSTGLE